MTEAYRRALVRSATYEVLARGLAYPDKAVVADLLRKAPALLKAMPAGDQALREALAEVEARLRATTEEALLSAYVGAFGHSVSADAPLYGAEYGQAHIFQKARALSDLVAFYRAWGVEVAPDARDRPDHVAVELEFMRLLALKEAYALVEGHGEDKAGLCRDAQRSFLAEHLGPWVRTFSSRLRRRAGEEDNVYAWMARLLDRHVEVEIRLLGLEEVLGASPLTLSPRDADETGACAAVRA